MYKITLTTIAIISSMLMVASPFININKANAISGSDFQPGRIIDDAIFTNKNSMSVAQIQQFLNAKVPNCEIWHSAYDANNPPPYTCLKDYQENPTNGDNNFGRYANGYPYNVPGGKRAAQIIWEAGQAYGINPQVLIVLLQKEQALVTDTWPLRSQFTKAMGYLCPDTAPCSSSAGGFYKQVFGAAWQFRHDFNGIDTLNYWSPYGKGWNNILYNPSSGCGTRRVYIETQATAVLYKYTPYTPNDAALASMNNNTAGGEVYCGAYGNRNFFWYFTKWFGSSITSAFYWSPVSQTSWYDQSMTKPIDTNNSTSNSKYFMRIQVRNDGKATWNKYTVNLGTSQPQNRTSNIYDSSWLSPNRVATIKEDQVAPGEYGTFEFWITTPSNPGMYREYFNLVADGITWMNDMGLYYDIRVNQPRYTWQWVSQGQYSDATKSSSINNLSVANSPIYMTLLVKNTGNVPWHKYRVNLATSSPKDRNSAIKHDTWLSSNRVTAFRENVVYPGELASFEFWSQPANIYGGTFKEYFNLVAENITWMNDMGLYYQFTSPYPKYTWEPYIQTAHTDSSKSIQSNLQSAGPKEKSFFTIKVKNIGNTVWRKYTVNLGTSQPQNRTSNIYDSSWLSPNRVATIKEDQVAPGEYGTFEFWITTPSNPGMYREYFNLVADGITWMNDMGLYYDIRVN